MQLNINTTEPWHEKKREETFLSNLFTDFIPEQIPIKRETEQQQQQQQKQGGRLCSNENELCTVTNKPYKMCRKQTSVISL